MPPIPIYTDAPITAAAKADGVTPQTAIPPTRTTQEPSTTTSTGGYPAAQPGAAAVPAPTPSIPRTAAPTRTTGTSNEGPAPPQPGAVPSAAVSTAAPTAAPTATIPAPPQLSIPAPQTNTAPTHSTAIVQPVSHPAGYHQDPYAAEMSAAQRASLEAAEARDRPHRNSISGILGGEEDGFGDAASPTAKAWGAVVGAVSSAGQGLARWEEGVWKKFG